jgi:hypothetical protein
MVPNMIIFCGEELFAHLPNLNLEYHSFGLATTAYSMYWQPKSIIKSFNFITSSCSLSPPVMQGTPFPFPCPSIVNKFLRRRAFFLNKEMFTMRPNNLTRCIFKTKVRNESRIENSESIYKRIHDIKEKHFKETNHQCTNKAIIRTRMQPADTLPKSGEICQKVLLETENSE